jgi:hypothetical protein
LTAQCYIPDDTTLQNHCYENLKFCDFGIAAERHIFAANDSKGPRNASGGKIEDIEQAFHGFMINKYQCPKPSKDFHRKTLMK